MPGPTLTEQIVRRRPNRKVGYGAADGIEMGPVISAESKSRIEGLIAKGEQEGARILVDGRSRKIVGYEERILRLPDGARPGAARCGDCAHGDLSARCSA